MRLFFSLALIGLFASFSAQETLTYPYNPDGNDDGAIASPDLLDILGVYGNAFTPTEILIDGAGLAEVINQIQAIIIELQDEINTLQLQNQWPSFVNGHLIIPGADLWGANLSFANLTFANLTGAELVYAYLSNANLYGTNLSFANLQVANLTGADLSNADLSNADLYGANLTGVTWTGAYINGCTGCNCVDEDGDNYCD
jgi:hypothetical protein